MPIHCGYKPAALPFAKFGLERGGQDGPSQRTVSDLALSRNPRLKVAIFKENHFKNPTAESKFSSLTATQTATNYYGRALSNAYINVFVPRYLQLTLVTSKRHAVIQTDLSRAFWR